MVRSYQAGNFSMTPQHKHILVEQNYEGHELDKPFLNHKQKIEGCVNINHCTTNENFEQNREKLPPTPFQDCQPETPAHGFSSRQHRCI
jgi:hypothetical protein